jgi:hypothetical protein
MLDLAGLRAFIETAQPGDAAVYYSGLVTDENKSQADSHMRTAWAAYVTGMFELVQKRIAPDDFDWIIQRRRRKATLIEWCAGKNESWHHQVRRGFVQVAA